MSIEEMVENQSENDLDDEEQETALVVEELESEETETVEEDDGEDVVSFGEESPPQEEDDGFNGQVAPQWVKDLRKTEREQKRRIRELEQQVGGTAETPKPQALGNKPKLEDYGYDEEQFSEAIDIWYDQKAQVGKQQAQQEAEQEAQKAEIQKAVDSYNEKKALLKVRDYDDAEYEVTEKLNLQQQGFIIEGAENPAALVYALGKNKARLEELAKIKNPAKFAFALAKLENQMKITKRKATTAPEKSVSGTGSTSGTTNTTLERLRAEAEKTGDFSKVGEYKRKLKQSKQRA